MAREIIVKADKIKKRKLFLKNVKLITICIVLFLGILYVILGVIYNGGRFTVTMDPNFSLESGIVIYENLDDKISRKKLYAEEIDFMDNISVKWLPNNINNEAEGTHNGKNYIAYTFYVENQGSTTTNYWYEIYADDIIKNVDDAIRIMVFRNDDKTIYAKADPDTGKPEPNTTPFNDRVLLILEKRGSFVPGDIDKFTVVIWLEGDDPDCVDNIIGGEIKMHMEITEEHIELNKQGV